MQIHEKYRLCKSKHPSRDDVPGPVSIPKDPAWDVEAGRMPVRIKFEFD